MKINLFSTNLFAKRMYFQRVFCAAWHGFENWIMLLDDFFMIHIFPLSKCEEVDILREENLLYPEALGKCTQENLCEHTEKVNSTQPLYGNDSTCERECQSLIDS